MVTFEKIKKKENDGFYINKQNKIKYIYTPK